MAENKTKTPPAAESLEYIAGAVHRLADAAHVQALCAAAQLSTDNVKQSELDAALKALRDWD